MLYKQHLSSSYGIVDLFAGPGGLGEGFASLELEGHQPFQVTISVECELSAYRTLKLRAFLREFKRRKGQLPREFIDFHAGRTTEPEWREVDSVSSHVANNEALLLELGTSEAMMTIKESVKTVRRQFNDIILIGGPPCQAYSLAGRARARGTVGYIPEDDHRHYLFRDYINILDCLRPAAFVMENVKGLLSSTINRSFVYDMLMDDLSSLGTGHGLAYDLRAIKIEHDYCTLGMVENPSDFIVRSEDFGVAQRRHRVIIVGLRSDIISRASQAKCPVPTTQCTLLDAIDNLPVVRSGLSRKLDNHDSWTAAIRSAASHLADVHQERNNDRLSARFREIGQLYRNRQSLPRSGSELPPDYGYSKHPLRQWLENRELQAIAQHETRTHMQSDLSRYLFASVYGEVMGSSPKANDFPPELKPCHRNWSSGSFSDRFRVQLANECSTTVTSHISKDGHYYVHYDPMQCRSMTVREAARVQTFPDDYMFLGNRTQQYVQVGNAVPPYLARTIACLLWQTLESPPVVPPRLD